VPNWSFEDTISCPANLDQVSKSVGWSSYKSTPDYFNSCSSGFVGVPANNFGYQYARNGVAYSGIHTYHAPHECIGIQLSSPLTIGQTYYGSFYVVRALGGIPNCNIAVNKIGMKATTTQYSASMPIAINNYAHIFTDSIISDTLNWVRISGSFVADSSYRYLSIGNFFNDSATTAFYYDTTSVFAYYYIDDVILSEDSNCCIGIAEPNSTVDQIKVFPNPTRNWIFIDGRNIVKVSIYDLLGNIRLVQDILFAPTTKIDISQLNTGIYLIHIESLSKNIIKKLIIR
jgi:hypothetical protein